MVEQPGGVDAAGAEGGAVFTHPSDIIRALRRYRDHYDPRSTSLMAVGSGSNDPHAEPFRAGFIDGIDERIELEQRLERLDERARKLLILWHVAGHPVARIARMLGMSRVHCYRVQRSALEAMLEDAASAPSGLSFASR